MISHIKNSGRCIRRKTSAVRAPLVNIKSSNPLELVSMDFLKVYACQGGILVM